ncbi:MAG: heavy metal translocating P-type ATPase, partial [Clostridia bacterium]|nr:heavy metal translocating P-type ATPase [Clostridia bacterium]
MDEKKTCTCGGTHEHHNHDHTEHHAHECGCSHEHHEGHNCDCAHEHHHGDHEHHEHHHDHACSCEHDHAPHHDSCTCEHGHEHYHEHSHGSCGCGCGHDHSHGPELPKWCMPLAIALFVLGAIAVHTLPVPAWVSGILFAAVILLAGVGVLIDGAKNLFKLNFTENVLMSVAVVAAFCMGEFVEAAAVAVLFNIGEQAEGIAEMRSRRSIEALTQMRPDTARVLRSGEEVTVDPSAVNPGEIIIVNPFERIPLDGEIVYGSSYID